MFARTRDAIEAHLTIVFTAVAVSREVQIRTGLSLRRFLRTLQPLLSPELGHLGAVPGWSLSDRSPSSSPIVTPCLYRQASSTAVASRG